MTTNRFPYRRTFILGFGFLGISIVWPIFNQFIPIFLQAGNPAFSEGQDVGGFALSLSPSLALFIMTWDNLINVFVQPWVGERSDRTWNRFGRRKGWIILGVPIAVLGFVSIPFAQSLLAIAVFILITNIGMAIFRSPTVAWLGDLFSVEERSQANGIINLMGGVGALLAFFGGGYLFDAFGRAAPFFFGALLLLAASSFAVLYVKEPRHGVPSIEPDTTGVIANLRTVFSNPNKSGLFVLVGILLWFMGFNALESGLSSFAVFSLGMTPGTASIASGSVSIAFILGAVPAGFIGSRAGRKRTIIGGLVGLTVVTLLGFVWIQAAFQFVVVLVLAGFFWALVNVNSLPLVYDFGDERRIGAYTGLYYFSSQLAAILGPTLSGVMVESLGNEYRWLWIFSALFLALAWLAMTQVRPSSSAI